MNVMVIGAVFIAALGLLMRKIADKYYRNLKNK